MKRNKIVTKINHQIVEIEPEKSMTMLASFLREDLSLSGTKVVCAEGDCGACTVLVGDKLNAAGEFEYVSMNSCILPVYKLDGAHVVTIEGLNQQDQLNPIQKSMVKCHGSQCGFCTPGFVNSLAFMCEELKNENKAISEKKVKNYLTGNLCRCTGYDGIIKAGLNINLSEVKLLKEQFDNSDLIDLNKMLKKKSLVYKDENAKLFLPVDIEEALDLKKEFPDSKVIAGGTDTSVLKNKGKANYTKIISLSHIEWLNEISLSDKFISIGANVTLKKVEEFFEKEVLEFKNLLHIFASPQIKNRATLIGNVVNGSPIGDTIPFLLALDALVLLQSSRGKRECLLSDFYLDYKKINLDKDELVTHVLIPRVLNNEKLKLYKASMRKDLDISAVSFAGLLKLNNSKEIEKINLAFGGVGPFALRIKNIEKEALNKKLDQNLINTLKVKLQNEIKPLSDLRASEKYRRSLAQNFLEKFLVEAGGMS